MVNQKKFKRLGFFIIIACLCVSLTGCETLREKFIRKKKAEKVSTENDPILQPIDYPTKNYSAKDRYPYYYSMWKVWYKELTGSSNSKPNAKRFEFLYEKLHEQLLGMREWLKSEKQAEFDGLIKSYEEVGSFFDQPDTMRDYSSFIRSLNHIDKNLRNQFKPSVIEPFYKDQIN